MDAPKPQSKPILIKSLPSSTTLPESFTHRGGGDVSWATLISHPRTPTDSICAGIASCPPHGGVHPQHTHTDSELYFALQGTATATVDGVRYELGPGSMLFVPGSLRHGLVNYGEVEFRWLYFFAVASFEDVVYSFVGEDQGQTGQFARTTGAVKSKL